MKKNGALSEAVGYHVPGKFQQHQDSASIDQRRFTSLEVPVLTHISSGSSNNDSYVALAVPVLTLIASSFYSAERFACLAPVVSLSLLNAISTSTKLALSTYSYVSPYQTCFQSTYDTILSRSKHTLLYMVRFNPASQPPRAVCKSCLKKSSSNSAVVSKP